jgi:hypothetical protein
LVDCKHGGTELFRKSDGLCRFLCEYVPIEILKTFELIPPMSPIENDEAEGAVPDDLRSLADKLGEMADGAGAREDVVEVITAEEVL